MPDVGDILDNYRLDAVIGRGGMGTVYRATDQALEKTVAVKVIAPHLADDDTFAGRFREEAKALARLDAPGIVQVYALRETDEALFLVMEHVDGPSLETVFQRHGTLPPDEGARLLKQILDAVQHAHDAGVLHRDLKPSNILLPPDGRATITDFGLAKILASDTSLTSTHERLGTVAYMSPEQIRGLRHVGPASDLFAVGLIGYEALTGQLPYDVTGSTYAVQHAIVEDSFEPPSAHAINLPEWLDDLVMDCLRKAPDDRPPSAAAALARFPSAVRSAETASINLPPVSSAASPRGPFGTHWLVLAGVAVALVAVAYLGVDAVLRGPAASSLRGDVSVAQRLSILSAPPAATARVNGDSVGTTPLRDQRVPAGSVRVQLSKPGYAALDTVVVTPPAERLTATLAARADTSPPSSAGDAAAEASSSSAASQPAEAERSNAPGATPPGFLRVRSEPGGATVRVDGDSIGTTPLVRGGLPPGPRTVTVGLDRYQSFTTSVNVLSRDTVLVTPRLEPRPAVVTLRAVPSGDVLVNGQPVARDASSAVVDSLPPGLHTLTLVSSQGRWQTTVELGPADTYERVVDLAQQVEVAIIARAPDGSPILNAEVVVNDSTVGYTPQRLSLGLGQHTVRLAKEGYEPSERTITVEPGESTSVTFPLTPEAESLQE